MDDQSRAVIQGNSVEQYRVGEVVSFGVYPQEDLYKDDRDLKWTIIKIDKENNRMLILSNYVIDNIENTKNDTQLDWKDSYIREWLNGSFINMQFSEDEKALIADTVICSEPEELIDKIFIPTYEEIYDEHKNIYRMRATEFAYYKGIDIYAEEKGKYDYHRYKDSPYGYSSDKNYCEGWLLSEDHLRLEWITGRGLHVMDYDGHKSSSGVRPELWIDFNAKD